MVGRAGRLGELCAGSGPEAVANASTRSTAACARPPAPGANPAPATAATLTPGRELA
jgi:hypothetical protein